MRLLESLFKIQLNRTNSTSAGMAVYMAVESTAKFERRSSGIFVRRDRSGELNVYMSQQQTATCMREKNFFFFFLLSISRKLGSLLSLSVKKKEKYKQGPMIH